MKGVSEVGAFHAVQSTVRIHQSTVRRARSAIEIKSKAGNIDGASPLQMNLASSYNKGLTNFGVFTVVSSSFA